MKFAVAMLLSLLFAVTAAAHTIGESALPLIMKSRDPSGLSDTCKPPTLWVNTRTGHLFACVDVNTWGRIRIDQ